jgi:maleylacetoacetate isomerase
LGNIDYEYRAVDLLAKAQSASAYTALNPGAKVPTLCIDGHVLTQSLAILEYLNATRTLELLPTDEYAKSLVRAMCLVVAADTQPVQNLAVLQRVAEVAGPEKADAEKTNWAKWAIEKGLSALESYVVAHGSDEFCYGTTLSMADLCLVPQMYNARRFGVDVATICPRCVKIDAHLAQLDAFKRAIPEAQPDKR